MNRVIRNRKKSKNKKKYNFYKHNWLLSIVILISAFLAYSIYEKIITKNAHYKDFGIAIPDGNFVHGIDVSKYQGNIDWNEVEKMESKGLKIEFAVCKVSESTNKVDRKWKRNLKKIRKTNIILGTYHFFRADKDAIWQAKNYLQNYTYKKGDIPPTLDFETTEGQTKEIIQNKAIQFLEYIEIETQTVPIIYTNVDFYEDYFSDEKFEKYPVWIAHYYEEKPDFDKVWTFWQHSDQGKVNSITQKVDFNVFNGNKRQLRALCNQ